MGNKQSVPGQSEEDTSVDEVTVKPTEPEELAEEETIELPPPMKPLSEPLLLSGNGEDSQCKRSSSLSLKEGSTSTEMATEIEQIVKERMEQHSENNDRQSNPVPRNVSVEVTDISHEDSPPLDSGAITEEEITSAVVEEQPEMDACASAIHKRKYVILELVETERDYVRDLKEVVDGYIANMKDPTSDIATPEDLKSGKMKMVFCNMENIYEFHRDIFLKALEKCIDEPQMIGPLFKKYERKLGMYIVYCQNKPVSEYIVSEHIDTYFEELRQKLGHKLTLGDLLIKPVQRIMKYQLLLKDIMKYTERTGIEEEINSLQQAVMVMHVVPKEANDMMNVGRLQGFDGKITAQGKLLLHGPLDVCIEGTQGTKCKELQVFFFEQSIIFSEAVGKKTQFSSPAYSYKAHLQVNKMTIEDSGSEDADPFKFVIRSTDPRKPNIAFVCQAANQESHMEWVSQINNILQTQKDFLTALQSPIKYQKKLTKEVSAPELSSVWNPTMWNATATGVIKNTQVANPNERSEDLSIPVLVEPLDNNTKQSKKNFLDGFRGSFRNKSGSGKSDEDSSIKRRWSENNPQKSVPEPVEPFAPGSVVKVLADFCAIRDDEINVSKSDQVRVLSHDESRGYLVRRCTTSNENTEGWIPIHVIQYDQRTVNRKPWSFRFRKPSFGRKDRDSGRKTSSSNRTVLPSCKSIDVESDLIPEYRPEFVDPLPSEITGKLGHSVVFQCRISPKGEPSVKWKRSAGDIFIAEDSKFTQSFNVDSGISKLVIKSCDTSDSGPYTCVATTDAGSSSTNTKLMVITSDFDAPIITEFEPTDYLIEWEDIADSENVITYVLETVIPSTNMWHIVETDIADTKYTVNNLEPGNTYLFRVTAVSNNNVYAISELSQPITIGPVIDDRLFTPDFLSRFIQMEEIGKGRFSTVYKCVEISSGNIVAGKFIRRQQQPRHKTITEYQLLGTINHSSIYKVLALYENPPFDVIVLEYIEGAELVHYLSKIDTYSESSIKNYCTQLLQALIYLHDNTIFHGDIKPENLLIEYNNPLHLILTDFGEARQTNGNLVLPDLITDLEFSSPEVVASQTLSIHADLWSTGVVLYLLLSGFSPFLDDSIEETTSNIINCDYSFPEDLFERIPKEAKELISSLLVLSPEERSNASTCIKSLWITQKEQSCLENLFSTHPLRRFLERRQIKSIESPVK